VILTPRRGGAVIVGRRISLHQLRILLEASICRQNRDQQAEQNPNVQFGKN
jgi:hypothetical protein